MSQCTKPDALKVQTGGNHYSKLKIQPMEFSMANKWDACAHTILKYVTRHQDKNGRQDLEKARHCVDMREALIPAGYQQPPAVIGIHAYCSGNNLGNAESQALDALDRWVQLRCDRDRLELIVALDNLIHGQYPNPAAGAGEL